MIEMLGGYKTLSYQNKRTNEVPVRFEHIFLISELLDFQDPTIFNCFLNTVAVAVASFKKITSNSANWNISPPYNHIQSEDCVKVMRQQAQTEIQETALQYMKISSGFFSFSLIDTGWTLECAPVVKHWNSHSERLWTFKTWLNMVLGKLLYLILLWARGWNSWSPEVPSSLNYLWVLVVNT